MNILKTLFAIAIGSTLLSFTPNQGFNNPDPGGIVFTTGTWQQALDKAAKEKRVVFLDAYAAWCGPCKFLKANVFTDPNVGQYFNSKFVNVQMDMEKGEGPALARKYGVTAYPTLFFIQPDGTVIKKSIGYLNSEQIMEFAKSLEITKS